MRVVITAFTLVMLGLFFVHAQSWAAASSSPQGTSAESKDMAGQAVAGQTVSPGKASVGKASPSHRKVASHKKSKKAIAKRHAKLRLAAKQTSGLTKAHVDFYTPLMRPGMPSRYDIAGWHAPKRSDLLRAVAFERRAKARTVRAETPVDTRPGWYRPDSRPGMIDRYDLRGMHGARVNART